MRKTPRPAKSSLSTPFSLIYTMSLFSRGSKWHGRTKDSSPSYACSESSTPSSADPICNAFNTKEQGNFDHLNLKSQSHDGTFDFRFFIELIKGFGNFSHFHRDIQIWVLTFQLCIHRGVTWRFASNFKPLFSVQDTYANAYFYSKNFTPSPWQLS